MARTAASRWAAARRAAPRRTIGPTSCRLAGRWLPGTGTGWAVAGVPAALNAATCLVISIRSGTASRGRSRESAAGRSAASAGRAAARGRRARRAIVATSQRLSGGRRPPRRKVGGEADHLGDVAADGVAGRLRRGRGRCSRSRRRDAHERLRPASRSSPSQSIVTISSPAAWRARRSRLRCRAGRLVRRRPIDAGRRAAGLEAGSRSCMPRVRSATSSPSARRCPGSARGANAVQRDAPVRRLEPGDSAAGGGDADRAAGVGAEGDVGVVGRDGDGGAARGTAGHEGSRRAGWPAFRTTGWCRSAASPARGGWPCRRCGHRRRERRRDRRRRARRARLALRWPRPGGRGHAGDVDEVLHRDAGPVAACVELGDEGALSCERGRGLLGVLGATEEDDLAGVEAPPMLHVHRRRSSGRLDRVGQWMVATTSVSLAVKPMRSNSLTSTCSPIASKNFGTSSRPRYAPYHGTDELAASAAQSTSSASSARTPSTSPCP